MPLAPRPTASRPEASTSEYEPGTLMSLPLKKIDVAKLLSFRSRHRLPCMRGAIKQLWLPNPDEFWKRVHFHGPQVPYVEGCCWDWARFHNPGGYGMVRPTTVASQRDFATLCAHRVAWEFEYGPIPEGCLVLHRCDRRICCRPSHLFLGDDQANSDDKLKKERGSWARGEAQHLAKLTEDAVRVIRAERAQTPPTELKALAARFGVSLVAVSMVALGKTWKHVR